MARVIADKWLWVTIISVVLVIVVPLIVVWGILNLSPEGAFIATIGLIVLWGIVSGYKDWVISKREKAEKPSSQ